MSSLHKNPRGSNNGATPSSQKKSSLPARVIRWTMFQIVSFVLAVLILGIGYAAVTWTNIPSGSGAAGQPVTQTLIQGIINNMNDLNTRVTAVNTQLDTVNPSGAVLSGSSLCLDGICKASWPAVTSGGTVTGPLRWSNEYSGKNYNQAWTACLALSPAGAWRIPAVNEIEYARRIDSSLFTGVKNYWSAETTDNFAGGWYLAWNPSYSYWGRCLGSVTNNCVNLGTGDPDYSPSTFRCVSDA